MIIDLTQPIDEFVKHPSEIIVKTVSYSDRLPSGVTVSSATIAAKDLHDASNVSSTVLGSTSGSTTSSATSFTAKAGTDGRDYLITVSSTLSDTEKFVDQILMHVRGI
jgi:hypothetical protein